MLCSFVSRKTGGRSSEELVSAQRKGTQMSSSTYIQNSPNSDASIDIETTGFGCIGVHNGVTTVCQYSTGVTPGQWTNAFENKSGVHIQTHPDTNPQSSWDMESGYFVCTVNTADNTITYTQTSAPSAEELESAAAVYSETKEKHKPLQDSGCGC